MIRRLVGVALGALFLVSASGTASAQLASPFTAYGTGIDAGSVVEARISGVSCGTTEADSMGAWILYIAATDPCAPKTGDTITFRLDGKPTSATATFEAGGAPADVANGITLEATGGASFSTTITKGVNLAVFSGGSIEDAIEAAPNASAFFVSVNGKLINYVVGAPTFVNSAFLAAFPDGIPANTVVIVVGK